jgi:hypothetical protein
MPRKKQPEPAKKRRDSGKNFSGAWTCGWQFLPLHNRVMHGAPSTSHLAPST